MKQEYTYTELVAPLNRKLVTLKRWGREFLPPDPSAGQQKGVSRRLSSDEAFTLFLGGHLVSEARLSVPQARTVLEDLDDFLTERCLKPSLYKGHHSPETPVWIVFIHLLQPSGFVYKARGVFEQNYVKHTETLAAGKRIEGHLVTERFLEFPVFPSQGSIDKMGGKAFYVNVTDVKILNLSELLMRFLARLGVDLFECKTPPRAVLMWP